MMTIVSSAGRQAVRRAAFVALAVSLITIGGSALRVAMAQRSSADLLVGVTGRKNRLRENRQVAGNVPKGPKPNALDRSHAVARLRSTLTKLAKEKRFEIDEFQASTDELPYITVYSTESEFPGWMQVAVRFSLNGRAPILLSALDSLKSLDVPFEVDSVEITRRSTDNSGMSLVAEQVQLRVLVYRGEA
ncbi:hypothetical protein EON82_07455 [bacterium]|nr:MAG: hypothetical protein EON82_07455 [bacterium]